MAKKAEFAIVKLHVKDIELSIPRFQKVLPDFNLFFTRTATIQNP